MSRQPRITGLFVLRIRRGLTLQQLEQLSGISHSALSAIERGLSRPRPITLHRLARALDLTPDVLRQLLRPVRNP